MSAYEFIPKLSDARQELVFDRMFLKDLTGSFIWRAGTILDRNLHYLEYRIMYNKS